MALSKAMRHVIRRCSTAEDWDKSGCTMGRQWPDLVAGYSGLGYATIRALVRRNLLRQKDDLYGLTPEGVLAWIELGPNK